jgi:hypothetical protein
VAAQDAIAAKARESNLGNPRPESPQPSQTPMPRNERWWQAFERDWVKGGFRFQIHRERRT